MRDAPRAVDLRPNAIVIGMLVDLLGSTVAGAVLFAAAGAPPEGDAATSIALLAVSLPLGLLITAVGGYVTARLAPGAEMNNAFVMGIAMTVLSAFLTAVSEPRPPLWYTLVGVLATTPAALLGGWVRARTAAKRAA